MNGIYFVARRISLFLALCSFTSMVGLSAHLTNTAPYAADEIFGAEYQYTAPVAYRELLYLYSETAHVLRIIRDDGSSTIMRTPITSGLVAIDEKHLIARLDDGIVLLLDLAEKKSVRIFGGIHNNSPRLTPTRHISLGDFEFTLVTNEISRALSVVVSHGGERWQTTKISGSPRINATLTLDNFNYSICGEQLCIKEISTNLTTKVKIGKGAQPPVVISEQKKLLAIVIRNDKNSGEVLLFDSLHEQIVKRLAVGPLALAPALLSEKLYVNCLGNHKIYAFDVSDVIALQSGSSEEH